MEDRLIAHPREYQVFMQTGSAWLDRPGGLVTTVLARR
jgi:hypothetical protein